MKSNQLVGAEQEESDPLIQRSLHKNPQPGFTTSKWERLPWLGLWLLQYLIGEAFSEWCLHPQIPIFSHGLGRSPSAATIQNYVPQLDWMLLCQWISSAHRGFRVSSAPPQQWAGKSDKNPLCLVSHCTVPALSLSSLALRSSPEHDLLL